MNTPLFNLASFTVCFEAKEEDTSAETHFIDECGWTEKEFRKIKDFPFFCAAVSIWKDGKKHAIEYLGCCCYRTEKEFHTRYRSDYFADMVSTCVNQINDSELSAAHAPWAELMRKEHEKKLLKAKQAREKRQNKKADHA